MAAIEIDKNLYWKARIDFNQLKADAQEVIRTLSGMNTQVEKQSTVMDRAYSRVGTAMKAYFSYEALKRFTGELINVRGEFQLLEVAFTTMLRSKEKADDLMKEMVDLALKTPFELSDVATGAKQLLAYSFSAKEITNTITMLGNVASGVKAPLSDIIYLYGTLRTQGRAYTRDILQFTSRGIPVLEALANQFKTSKDKVMELVQEGKVGFPEIEKVFKSMTEQGGIFYNLMEEQAKTLPGYISNMKDAWHQLFNDLGKESEGFFAGVIKGLTEMINAVRDAVKGTEGMGIEAGDKSFKGWLSSLSGKSETDAFNAIGDRIKLISGMIDTAQARLSKKQKLNKTGMNAVVHLFGWEVFDTNVDVGVIKSYQTELKKLRDLMKNPEGLKNAISVDKIVPPPNTGEKVKDLSNTLAGLREQVKKLDQQIEETQLSGDWERKLKELGEQRRIVLQQIDDITTPTDRLGDYLDNMISFNPIATKPVSSPLAKEAQNTARATQEMQLSYRALYDSIDHLSRRSLVNRLNNLKTDLQYTKLTAEQKKEIEEKLAKAIEAIDDKTAKNINLISDALMELGGIINELVGGDLGRQLQQLGSGISSAIQGIASGNYVQAAAGLFQTVGALTELVSGTAAAAKEQALFYESQQKWLGYITDELEKQLEITQKLKGIEIYSGYTSSIEQTTRDVAEIEKKMQAIFRLRDYVGISLPDKYVDKSIENIIKTVEEANANNGEVKFGNGSVFISKDDLALLNQYIDTYKQGKEQILQMENQFREAITGTTYEGLLSSIMDAFKDGEMSAQEMADFTEEAMKKAVMKSFEIKFLQEQMQNWYEAFAKANEDGAITEDERKKLVADFEKKMTEANQGLKAMSDAMGIKWTEDGSKPDTFGRQIAGVTEETAGKIEGAFNGVRISNLQILSITQKNFEKLDLIERHTNTLYEIRDILKRQSNNQLISDRANGI